MDLQVLSKKEAIEFHTKDFIKSVISNDSATTGNHQATLPEPLTLDLNLSSQLESNFTDSEEESISHYQNETFTDFSNASLELDLNYDFKDKSIQMIPQKESAVIEISQAVILRSVIALWQLLLLCGLMLACIIFCWIVVSLMIEFFALNFPSNKD